MLNSTPVGLSLSPLKQGTTQWNVWRVRLHLLDSIALDTLKMTADEAASAGGDDNVTCIEFDNILNVRDVGFTVNRFTGKR